MLTLFNTATGEFSGVVSDGVSYPSDLTAVEGVYDQYSRLETVGAFSAVVQLTQDAIDDLEAEEAIEERREERRRKFAETIDKMNPIWLEELSSTAYDDLREFRQTWLDYPATGIKPDDLDFFN